MKRKYILLLFLTAIILCLFPMDRIIVAAQSSLEWAPANSIPFYGDLNPPYLVADQNYTVHAFNDESIDAGGKIINYRKWTMNSGWSQPTDILLPNPTINNPLQGVSLDQDGKFNLIYFGGFIEGGDIYYTRAWASEADRATAWEKPFIVAPNAFPLPDAALIGNGTGDLYVVYVGEGDGLGIYEVHSNDGGDTWSDPTPVSFLFDANLFPAHIELTLDKEQNLHAVWSIMNERGLGEKVYYARRDVSTGQWSEPFLIAAREGNDYAADWGSIIEYKDLLIIMYMDGTIPAGIPPTRWMRTSKDGGRTWTEPVQPFPHVGENGIAVMLIDSSNELHILLANRVGEPAIGGLWHGVWLGSSWSDLEMVTARTPQEALASGAYADGNSASRPTAVISQGNVILATWWHDMGDAPPAAFSYAVLDSPVLPAIPLPTPPATEAPSDTTLNSTPTPVVTTTPTPVFLLTDAEKSTPPDYTPATSLTPVLVSVISASIIILAIVLIRWLYYRSSP